jgi:hypothetical protein
MKQNLLQKITLTLCICLVITLKSFAQNPGLIISEFLANPANTDSPFEYVEFRASKNIDFSITPYSVVVSNNGVATAAGWIAGGGLTYGFSINTGTVAVGDVVYVGGSLMAPTGTKLRTINTGSVSGDGFGNFASGVFGNGGANADGIAVFAADIAALTNTSVPVDAIFYGTGIGNATVTTGGYELPINDLYAGGKIQSNSFFAPEPSSGFSTIAACTFDPTGNTYLSTRVWSVSTTTVITDGTSSILLSSVVPPANVAFTSDNQTVLESVGTVTANISITSSNSNPSSVEVVLIPFGTTINGSDLAYTTQTITFAGNSTGTLPVNINITDDAIGEESEYFVLRLQNPVNANFSGITQQTIFIKDNENITPVGNNEVTMSFVSSFTNGVSASNSAEIVAHDPLSKRLFVANSIGKKLDIINFSNPAAMSIISSKDISSYGNINSVAVKNGIVACAIENTIPEQDGFVVFFDTNGVFQKQVTVGALPDMITFNHSGTRVLTANEGQPNTTYTIDPEGSVSIIDISGGIASLSQSNVTTALFTAFNSQATALKASGVRIYGPGATVAQDMEPEYITISDDDLTAYVALQENNALAYVNLTTNTITDIKPLGFKDHSVFGKGLDATNTGTNVNIANWPIKGMYLPDGMTHFNVGGVEYLITANEGDARADYGAANNEETTIGAATYSLDPIAFPYASAMKSNANLGRLKCTNRLGDTDNDGDFDEIYTFGARSFSIWNAATGTLVYDSGDDLEQITSKDPTYGAMFNCSNNNITKKDRSDDKGPEPEGVVVATVAGVPYAFVSMERVGGLMVFNISNPAAPQFVQYVNNRGLTGLTGDRGPEGIIYINQQDSPNGKSLIVLGNEVSSSVSVYEIACPASSATLAAVSSTTACAGNTLTINTSTISGASYAWYNGTTLISGATSAMYSTTVSGNYSVKLNNVGCTIPSNTVSLTFNALPSITLTANSTSICTTQSVSILASGATTYTWSDGSNNATYNTTPISSSIYSITGVDANNCSNTASISISVNPTPTVVISASQLAVCPNETAILSLSGASTYTWTDGSNITSYSVSPTSNTTYSVTGTDADGCIGNSILTITANPSPTILISTSNTVICSGNSVALTATGASTYTWTNGPSTSVYSVTPTNNSTYSVSGTNANNCSSSGVITISVNITPTVSISATSNTICAGQTTTLSAIGATSFTWSDGSNNTTYNTTPISSSIYSVTGVDANNCSNTASISISVNATPTVVISASQLAVCPNENAILSLSGALTYTWTDGSNITSYSVSPTLNTTYSVTGTDADGCIGNSILTITANPSPTILISTSQSVICEGNSSLLTANGATSYTWTNGPNTSTYTVNPSTNSTYTVEGLDNNNCFNTSIITVSVTANPTVSAIASSTAICAGQTVTLTANGASTYTWLPSGSILTNEIVAPTGNTTYSLSGISNGCSGNAYVQIIVNQLPTISVSTTNSLICTGESVVLTASSNASSYLWSNSAITMSISITPTTTTIYSITVSDGLCYASSSITQNVSACTAVNEIHENNRVLVYPNPFNNSFEIKWDFNASSDKKMLMNVYNVLGEIILSTTISENNTKINTNEWRIGSYFVKVNNQVYKIIKQ